MPLGPSRAGWNGNPPTEVSTEHPFTTLPKSPGRRFDLYRWPPLMAAAILWITLIYGVPLQSLHVARRLAREELTHLLQTDKPDTAAILNSFDQATGRILFSAAGPYFILAAATIFLISHLATVKRRLDAAERDIRLPRDVLLGVDGVPLK